jgi:hypothetical protein
MRLYMERRAHPRRTRAADRADVERVEPVTHEDLSKDLGDLLDEVDDVLAENADEVGGPRS